MIIIREKIEKQKDGTGPGGIIPLGPVPWVKVYGLFQPLWREEASLSLELEKATEGLKMTVEDQLTETMERMKLAKDEDESPIILKQAEFQKMS